MGASKVVWAIRPSGRLVLLAFVSLLLAGCGQHSASSTSTSASSSRSATAGVTRTAARVSISGYAFHSATITVKLGTKLTFTNHDQTAHTATSTTAAFDTGTVKPGASATITFTRPGTYTYFCQFHAFMHGTVVVK